jgi:hypothetical protein
MACEWDDASCDVWHHCNRRISVETLRMDKQMGRICHVLVIVFAMTTGAALAQEPVGCDKFKWPVEKERALLTSAKPVAPGGDVAQPLAAGVKLPLVPIADSKLPMEPSRKPKMAESYAGFIRYAALPRAGTYRVTLSEGAWIDVVQDGQEVKSIAHTGAMACDGIRKSVKFDLAASPFIIEISGTEVREIAIAVTPD